MIKVLIAYFSRKGKNYVGGSIADLPVGNTEIVARILREHTGGDLFHIDTVTPYPEDYYETIDITKTETREKARPLLKETVSDLNAYAVICLGYPIWWGTMPMAVFSFLEAYDFSGKTIAPFCTHEGSGMGNSVRDIKKLCPKAKVTAGLDIRGSAADTAADLLPVWINKLGLKT